MFLRDVLDAVAAHPVAAVFVAWVVIVVLEQFLETVRAVLEQFLETVRALRRG